ncbi:hypothetical protein [Nostoc sp.]
MSTKGDRLCEIHSEEAIALTPKLSTKGDRLYKGHGETAIAPHLI